MTIGKIKPTATLVAQFPAGVEVDAIQEDGKIFLPVISLGELTPAEPAPKTESKKKAEPDPEPETGETTYTEEQMMEMSSKDLEKILKNEFEVNPDDYPGKNTNKKLRDLILKAQDGGLGDVPASEKEDEEEKLAPKKKGKKSEPEENEEAPADTDDLAETVVGFLEDFDSGNLNRKNLLKKIVALSEDVDEDAVSEIITKFEDDAEADIDATAKDIAGVLRGEAPKKKGKKSAPKKSKEEVVDVEDLEVGDKVNVYWGEDYDEWYKGVVKSIKKGKVNIAYEDGTEEIIDPELHTEIHRLA